MRRTRRRFVAELTRTLAGGAVGLHLPLLTVLAGCADGAAAFAHLTPAEARAVRAFAARILPSEAGSPGAEEAGTVHFVDRAFGDPFFADAVAIVRAGLADLDARARAAGGRDGFASLPEADQAALLRRIDAGPFFAAARLLVLIGTFADPAHGGNRGGAGLAIVGVEHRPTYAAPFGWYDARGGG